MENKKEEIEMLVLCMDLDLKEKIHDLFEKNKIKIVFSESRTISGVEKDLLRKYDAYCIARNFEEDNFKTSYCTIAMPRGLR